MEYPYGRSACSVVCKRGDRWYAAVAVVKSGRVIVTARGWFPGTDAGYVDACIRRDLTEEEVGAVYEIPVTRMD